VNFRPENGERGGASGGPPGGPDSERLRAPLGGQEERRRGRSTSRRPFVPVVVGILLLALVIGLLILWSSYGDRAGGTSIYEDSIESGTEPMIHITNGPGRVRIEGVEGLETVEISAKRYARGRNPTAAKSNASGVPVDIANDGSTLEISSDGGGGTGVDYDLRVPPGATVEIESVAGDVEISGLDNDATARVESGDVSMEDVQGSIAIEAPQGDVTVKSISTETGNVDITVGSGDLDLENLVVGIMEARVDSGDVTLLGRFSGSGRVLVETGSINVRLPSEDTNDLTFETRVGEVIRDNEQESG
jgi:hypothetical protein